MTRHPAAASALLLAIALPGQVPDAVFSFAPLLPPAGVPVHDSRRNVTVVLELPPASQRMWEWDGNAFRERLGPPQAYGQPWTASYDPIRGELHTLDVGVLRTWDGRGWRTTPYPNTWSLALSTYAYDCVRQRLVALFGQPQTAPHVAEWDGATWTRVVPPTNPGGGGSLVFDPSRGRCVYAVGTPVELWEWNGLDWTLVDPNGPTGVVGKLAHDPGANRLLLHGNSGAGLATWAYDASGWQPIWTPAGMGVATGALAWDGIGMLLMDAGWYRDRGFWRLVGATWQRLPIDHPRARGSFAIGESPSGILVFGGSDGGFARRGDTWTFDGSWHRATPASSPSPRQDAGLAWAPASGHFVLYGGHDGTQLLTDTWTFDGATWTQRQPTNVPPQRANPVVVTDPAGGVLLLNFVATSWNNDQWQWNGTNWVYQPSFVPAFLGAWTAATFDPIRNRVVAVSEGTTSEWDGSAWTAFGPNPTVWPVHLQLVFRPETLRVLAYQQGQPIHHEWDGSTWTPVDLGTQGQNLRAYLATDLARGRVLSLFHPVPTWPYRSEHAAVLTSAPAAVVPFGVGCALGAAPVLGASGRPEIGDQAFALDLEAITPGVLAAIAAGFAPAPVNLGGGCTALVPQPAALKLAVTSAVGTARAPAPIPNDAALLGVTFDAQGAVLDPARSPIGHVTLTGGLRVTVGR